jgi:hypothetical protein
LPGQERKRPRGVVDTSVLVAGIAELKPPAIAPKNPSANLLRNWIEGDTFVWLVSDEILLEYKRVLGRLGVRRPSSGRSSICSGKRRNLFLPLLCQTSLPIPETIPSARALKLA